MRPCPRGPAFAAMTAAHSLLHFPAPNLAAPAHLAPATIAFPRCRHGHLAARYGSRNEDLTASPNPNDILVAASVVPQPHQNLCCHLPLQLPISIFRTTSI
ncbi:hypothetical protein GUJ93_ZPchr0010g10186 [Zizania palustris]|uniref:Uncharacterized protein n=1 Tax=Zizania palustris TaxID=103762 RepID=A0A8J5SZD8_ZIZPA|nr:hypothetical protein GUJ93_ZPchr0010g10186 [Zizania palustris]